MTDNPTKNEIEEAARILCRARGLDPDDNIEYIDGYDPVEDTHYKIPSHYCVPNTREPIPNWKRLSHEAMEILLIANFALRGKSS